VVIYGEYLSREVINTKERFFKPNNFVISEYNFYKNNFKEI